jgi:hypothetical protein
VLELDEANGERSGSLSTCVGALGRCRLGLWVTLKGVATGSGMMVGVQVPKLDETNGGSS